MCGGVVFPVACRSVVAVGAIGVARLVDIERARKGDEGRRRGGMTRNAILTVYAECPGYEEVASAPLVPWLSYEPLWQLSQRLALTAE